MSKINNLQKNRQGDLPAHQIWHYCTVFWKSLNKKKFYTKKIMLNNVDDSNKKTMPKLVCGFTLIEMMVAVSLFVIVVMISMTAILSVVDSTKKAQSLKSVMNNLNFALETMTRTMKTGQMPSLNTDPQDSILVTDQSGNPVTYSLSDHRIMKNSEPITAPEVIVNNLKFYPSGGVQPSVIMVVQGTMKMSERISSDFNIQTTITQRVPAEPIF
jgi:prepilin-type N-terminal cleavage/methylation domain-containing protein